MPLQNLTALRIHLGISQADMGVLLCMPQRTYSNYEVGKTRLLAEQALRLMECFDLTLRQLLDHDPVDLSVYTPRAPRHWQFKGAHPRHFA
jgi:transcriptional regulator with XRE-family HTH domain